MGFTDIANSIWAPNVRAEQSRAKAQAAQTFFQLAQDQSVTPEARAWASQHGFNIMSDNVKPKDMWKVPETFPSKQPPKVATTGGPQDYAAASFAPEPSQADIGNAGRGVGPTSVAPPSVGMFRSQEEMTQQAIQDAAAKARALDEATFASRKALAEAGRAGKTSGSFSMLGPQVQQEISLGNVDNADDFQGFDFTAKDWDFKAFRLATGQLVIHPQALPARVVQGVDAQGNKTFAFADTRQKTVTAPQGTSTVQPAKTTQAKHYVDPKGQWWDYEVDTQTNKPITDANNHVVFTPVAPPVGVLPTSIATEQYVQIPGGGKKREVVESTRTRPVVKGGAVPGGVTPGAEPPVLTPEQLPQPSRPTSSKEAQQKAVTTVGPAATPPPPSTTPPPQAAPAPDSRSVAHPIDDTPPLITTSPDPLYNYDTASPAELVRRSENGEFKLENYANPHVITQAIDTRDNTPMQTLTPSEFDYSKSLTGRDSYLAPQPAPLTSFQLRTVYTSMKAYNATITIMKKLYDHSDVLTSLISAGKVWLAVDDKDSSRFIVRMMGLSKEEAEVAADYKSMMEHVQKMRTPLGGAGFRSLEAFLALQAQKGHPLMNPMMMRRLLENSMKTFLTLRSSDLYSANCTLHKVTFADKVTQAQYLMAYGTTNPYATAEEKAQARAEAREAMKYDGYTKFVQ